MSGIEVASPNVPIRNGTEHHHHTSGPWLLELRRIDACHRAQEHRTLFTRRYLKYTKIDSYIRVSWSSLVHLHRFIRIAALLNRLSLTQYSATPSQILTMSAQCDLEKSIMVTPCTHSEHSMGQSESATIAFNKTTSEVGASATPQDPVTWPRSYKWFIVTVLAFMTLAGLVKSKTCFPEK